MNLKRSLALALSVLILLTVSPVAFGAEGVLPRISGSDRYATAVAISQEGWESAVTVVLARGDHFADALAGVPLAYKLEAPILLTAKDSLPAATKNEILRLNATKVVILGGTGAVSKAVADEIAGMGILVGRIAGANRYETAAKIADEVVEEGKVGTVVLANGLNFADALAAAPYAAANGFPILLTPPSALPEDTENKINELAPNAMIIVGGTSAISSDVMTAVSTRNPVRVFGKDRYATAIALANHFAPETTMMYVASGLDFPDAITGAALAARKGTGLLLVGNTLSDDVKNFINEFGIFDATIFGGLKAVNTAVDNAVYAALVGATETGVAGWAVGYTTVSIGGKTATADVYGFYKVTGVAPGTHKATFKHTGYATVEQDIKVYKDRLSVNHPGLEILDADDIQVQIVAVDGNGAPVPGAKVILQVWNSKAKSYGAKLYPGLTDEQGMLTWGNPEQGDEGNVFAFGDKVKVMIGIDPVVNSEANTITGAYHWVTREVNLATDAELNELDGFVLTPVKKMNISGQVTGFFGEPVEADNTVTFVFKSDPNGIMGVGQSITATVNAKGEFQFKDLTLPTRKYVIQFVPTNPTAAIHAKPVSITEGTNLVHNIKLEKGYNVEFRLDTEEAGERFKNDGVTAAIYDGDLLLITLNAALQTGGQYFTITGDRFAAGNYTMKVAGDYIIAKSFPLGISAAAADENGLVKLAGRTYRAGVITVEVFDNSATPTPVALDAFIELIDASGKVVETSIIETSSCSFVGLPHNAKYTVRASTGGWSTEIRPTEKLDEKVAVTVIANEEVKQSITLKPVPKYANVAGYVRTAGTYVPAAGAKVYFHALNVIAPDGDPYPTNYYGTEGNYWTADVAATGYYSITDLRPGTYRVVIRDPGKHEYNISTITLKAGDDLKANNYFLTPGGNATFKVKVTAGTAVQTAQKLYDAFGIEITASSTDGDYQVFTDLSGGIYNVVLKNVTGYKNVNDSFAVAKGKETKKEIKMVAMDDSYAVTFTVFGKESTDISTGTNILVYSGSTLVWDNSGELVDGETKNCALLPDGNYTVEYWAQDYLLDTQNFTVKGAALFVPVLQLDAWQ